MLYIHSIREVCSGQWFSVESNISLIMAMSSK